MFVCGLFFKLLSAFIQNPHEHRNVERLLFALAQFVDIRLADGCYFELNSFSLQWHYLLFSIFCKGREKEVKTKIWLSRTWLLHRLYLFYRSCSSIHNTVELALYTDFIRTLLDMSRTVSILSRTLPRLAHTLSRLILTRYTFTCCEQYTS